MPRFAVKDSRYVMVNDDGTIGSLPWPGHAASIIDALRRHGGTATPTTRTSRYSGGLYEEVVIEAPPHIKDSYEAWYWEVNGGLLSNALRDGLLVEREDGTVALNTEMADWHDQWKAFVEQRQRDAKAQRILAREFEIDRADAARYRS